jgi:hypothetical protein
MDSNQLLAEASQLENLDGAFKWAMNRSPRFMPGDVVIQDEYTHDVMFRALEDLFVVFDAT